MQGSAPQTGQSDAWREQMFAFVRENALPVEKYGHQPRLYQLTRELGETLQYDDEVVCAAAWLHDLGVFAGHRPEDPDELARWDSVAYACEKVPGLLLGWGFPQNKLEAVLGCIRTHQPQHTPRTTEATILRDADILEQLGAVGILRTVCKVGRDTRFQTFSEAVASLRRAQDTLPQLLCLPTARALAAERIAILRAWLAAVEAEAGDRLF